MRKLVGSLVLALALFLPSPSFAVFTTPNLLGPGLAANTPGAMPFTAQELGELKGVQPGMCPDGRRVITEMYDPDPSDPQAAIYVFRSGSVLIAIRQTSSTQDRVYVAVEGKWYSIDEARAKYPTPCAIPFSGR